MIDYDVIKDMAKENGLRVADLCALSPNNDPFYTGRPSELIAAEWFAKLWEQFGYKSNIHLRRIHYRIVSSDPPVLRPDGAAYENTEKDWGYLNNAGKWARYLGLVSVEAFVDRRNPDAILYAHWPKEGDPGYDNPTPDYSVDNPWPDWSDHYQLPELPKLEALRRKLPDLPSFDVWGYNDIQQAYHLEIWCEKTTMNDILEPICRRYNVNLVTGAGEMSITSVVEFLRRVEQADRPARILYISDYDPAGLGMPISVARKVEFFLRTEPHRYGELDVRLQPVCLHKEQVDAYNLPRIPVKDSDKRKANFEAGHGQGQVELDALEALYPGDLEQIVTQTVLQYYDPDLHDRSRGRKRNLINDLENERLNIIAVHQEDIDDLETKYGDLVTVFDKTREVFDTLVADFKPQIEGHQTQLDDIRQQAERLYDQIVGDLIQVEMDLYGDDYCLPEPNLPLELDDQLYVSQRDYIEQLTAYKAYRTGIEVAV